MSIRTMSGQIPINFRTSSHSRPPNNFERWLVLRQACTDSYQPRSSAIRIRMANWHFHTIEFPPEVLSMVRPADTSVRSLSPPNKAICPLEQIGFSTDTSSTNTFTLSCS
jgi:hypothetical protein